MSDVTRHTGLLRGAGRHHAALIHNDASKPHE
jgi:hypothetical protein